MIRSRTWRYFHQVSGLTLVAMQSPRTDRQHVLNILVLLAAAGLSLAFAAGGQAYAAVAVAVLGGTLAASMAEAPRR